MRSVQAITHFERSDLLTVMVIKQITTLSDHNAMIETLNAKSTPLSEGKPNIARRHTATRFLTATIYTFLRRAGITAAAGTRLSLCLILTGWFKPDPFQ